MRKGVRDRSRKLARAGSAPSDLDLVEEWSVLSRRRLFAEVATVATSFGAAWAARADVLGPSPVAVPGGSDPIALAMDERFWRGIARQYQVPVSGDCLIHIQSADHWK